MRIYTEATEAPMHGLAESIARDPLSLAAWSCVHIPHDPCSPPEIRIACAQAMQHAHKNLDCEVMMCANHDMILLSRDIKEEALLALAKDWWPEIPEIPNKSYNLFRDWQEVRKLFCDHMVLHALPNPKQPVNTIAPILPEENVLYHVFSEAKRLRLHRTPLQVMLVEDDMFTRRLVSHSLKDSYSMIGASHAQEAVSNYLLHAPDIVFLDIGLPDRDGFEVLHEIMRHDPQAYVVMFSSNGYLDNVIKALQAGASGFISKPFQRAAMEIYIQDSALHHHKMMRKDS